MKLKAKVLTTIKNKYSKALHKKGDVIEVSEKRYKEINGTKHGQLVEKVKED